MKIVYLIPSLGKIGGTEQVVISKANYFAENLSYEIHLIIMNQGNNKVFYNISKLVQVHDLNISKFLSKIKIPVLTFFKNILIVKRILKTKIDKLNPQIIIVAERGYADFIVPSLNKNILTIRESHSSLEAVEIMDNNLKLKNKYKNLFFTWLYKKQLKKYNLNILLTERDKRSRKYLKNAIVIPNIVPLQYPKNVKSDLNTKIAISVGRLDKFKNHRDQILVWKNIVNRYPNWKLYIYGEGSERNNLESLIESNHLQNNVFLKGISNKIGEAYLESSFFIFTSLAEGFGLVLVEAMQKGLPVISYNIPCGPSDIILNNVNGYLIKKRDLNELERKILILIENKKKRYEMGRNAIKRSSNYLPEKIMNRWNKLFLEHIK